MIANKSTIARYVTHRAFFVPFTVHFSFHPKSTIARCVKHHCVRVSLVMQQCSDLLGCYIKQIMNVFHSCNRANICIRCKMECSIQLGSASLNRTFLLSTHENIRTIALINIHYLYNIPVYSLAYSPHKLTDRTLRQLT